MHKPTTTPSNVLDNVTTNRPICLRHQVEDGVIIEDKCGKPATYEMIRTCCDGPVTTLCDEHTVTTQQRLLICPHCGHVCVPGSCYHRIVNPL